MMNKNKFVLGAAAAFTLGAASCGEAGPTRAEQVREYVQLRADESAALEEWNNCGVLAREGKRRGTIAYMYAQYNECTDEYAKYDTAFMRRQRWEETHTYRD